MADNKSLERVARVHTMAKDVIAEKLINMAVGRLTPTALADAILAELAAHDPPLLICTPDEIKE